MQVLEKHFFMTFSSSLLANRVEGGHGIENTVKRSRLLVKIELETRALGQPSEGINCSIELLGMNAQELSQSSKWILPGLTVLNTHSLFTELAHQIPQIPRCGESP